MSVKKTYLTLVQEGSISFGSGDYSAAKTAFEAALKIRPDTYEVLLDLSKTLYYLAEFPAAIQLCTRAETCDPLKEDFQRVQAAVQSKRFGEAQKIARAMLEKQTGHSRAIFTLAHIYQMQRAYEDEVAILRNGLQEVPANMFLRQLLLRALENAGDITGAVETAKHLLEMQKTFSNAWALLGVYIRNGFNEEALAVCQMSLPLCENDKALLSEIDLLRGHALKTLGRREEAILAYKSCISNKPQSGAPWWALADMKTYEFSKAERDRLKALVDSKMLAADHQCQALFAFAKAQETQTNLKDAMPYYERANAAYPSSQFNPSQFFKSVRLITASLDEAVLSCQARPEFKGPTPIFIIGLPRSGSTLMEQILSSHTKIEGTMELPVLPNVKRKMHLESLEQFNLPFLQGLAKFSQNDLARFGQTYLDDCAIFYSKNTAYFIDKLPHNFEHVGLIHKILPHAVFIDVRRNPMDCGLSLFKQFFSRGVEFSYNLENIGAYYSGYLELMNHWDTVLPRRVLHIGYEDLVLNLDEQLRQILAHIGVEYERGCLEFYKTKRAVRTASSEQVRMPLFTSGIGKWKQVEKYLRPLKEGLDRKWSN